MPKGVRRTEDEKLNGAVVMWSKKGVKVPVKYLCCGRVREITSNAVAELRTRSKVWCSMCRPRDYGRQPEKDFIIINGYKFVHVDFLFPEERKMAMEMGRQGRGGKYVAEHRLRAAMRLGRPLAEKDSVHHDNGDKLDNSDENLVVIPQSLHKLTHWEVLRELARLKERLGEI